MKGHIGVYEFARRTGRDVTALYKLLLTGRIEGATKSPSGRWRIPEGQVKPYTKAKDVYAEVTPGGDRNADRN